MLLTWGGALTSWRRWLQACGLLRRSSSPSTSGVSFIFSLSSSVPQSPSLWTTPRQCQVAQAGGHSLLDPQCHCTTNYRSMLSPVFRFKLPEISTCLISFVLLRWRPLFVLSALLLGTWMRYSIPELVHL